MGKYLTLFSSHTSYEEYINGPDAILPNVSYCEDVEDVYFNPYVHDYSKDYLTFRIINSGYINWACGVEDGATIEYKKNDGEWTSITANVEERVTIDVVTGDIVQFRGDNDAYVDNESGYAKGYFASSTCGFELEGNIMSMINSTGYSNITAMTSGNNAAFSMMFDGCTGLTSAENLVLPATTLAEQCYKYMFWNCTSLTTPPELPATTLAESCYSSMFAGCTSLTTGPELPATTLAVGCYGSMFNGCTSLTIAPELPATTLTGRCYRYMFDGCTNLNYIKCLATDISASDCTYNWVSSVSSTGTFVKNPNMSSWTTGTDGIPTNWTVQDAS